MSAGPELAAPPGRRMQGPSALAGGLRRFVYLTRTIAVQEFKLRFFGSVLGYLWQLMRPLLLFGVLYVVFTQFVRFGTAPHYPVVLLTNIVLFQFFAEATSGSVSSVLDREQLVRKIHFPRLAIPLAVVLTAMFNLGVNLIAVAIFILASGLSPRWSWLEMVPLLGVLILFASGLAMLLSILFVRFRDVRPIWEVILQALFYATPVIYVIDHLQHPWMGRAAMLNPLGAVVEQVRHAVIDPHAAGAAAAAGGWGRMLIPATIVLASLIGGFWLFNRDASSVAENL